MGYPDKLQKRVTKRQPQHECLVCRQMFEDVFDLTSHARTHNGPARSYSRARKAPKSPAVLHDTGHQTQVNREQTEDALTLKRNGHSGKQIPDVSELTSTADSNSGHKNENLMQDIVTVKEDTEDRCFEKSVSPEAAQMGLYKDHVIKDELVLGPILLQPRDVAFIVQNNNEKEPTSTVDSPTANDEETVSQDSVTVKVEPEERCFEESVSPETAKIGVYKGHQIKDELVLWPELLQQAAEAQDAAIVVHQNNEQELSTVDNPITNYKDTVTVKVDPEERCFDEGVTEAIAVDHLEHPLKCNHCDYATSYEILLNQHLMTHTGDQPDKHGDVNNGGNGQLTIHSRTYTGVKPLKCSHCDYATHLSDLLRRHQLKHTTYKPFKCSYCDYATQYNHILQRHQLKHTTYKPFKCSHCDYATHDSNLLQQHQLKHTTYKPFKCSHCDYSSRYKQATDLHELKHNDCNPFKCSHCDYATYHGSLLRRHAKKHMRDKPFKCSQCDYTTAYRGHLTQHKIKHSSDKPFMCRYCDYTSRYKSNVTSHELRRLWTCHTGSVRPKLVFTAETETEILVQL